MTETIEMVRCAVIDEDVVSNIVLAEADFASEEGWIVADEGVEIGWFYVDGEFSAPAAPDPADLRALTPRQARLALLDAGLLDDAEAAIDGLLEPQKTAAKIEWEYATEIRRDAPLIALVGGLLGLSDTQIDDLFKLAVTK